jgi:hypothetical protein
VFLPLSDKKPTLTGQFAALGRCQDSCAWNLREFAIAYRAPLPEAPALFQVSLATLHVQVDADVLVPDGLYGRAIEAALLIRVWSERGYLYGLSGHALATSLQQWWFPLSVRARYPRRGLALLREIDATADLHGVSVYVDRLVDGAYRETRLAR